MSDKEVQLYKELEDVKILLAQATNIICELDAELLPCNKEYLDSELSAKVAKLFDDASKY